ncbi:MAG: hypothetical protein AAGG01_20660, partial [Planctomycetota bacterium]
SWILAALSGANAAANEHGAELVAGDLASAPGPIALSVTALGSVPLGARLVGRDRAEAGQVVVVSGPLGGSLESGRHLRPVPRIAEGIAIAAAGATAMMDVSDGLVWDLYRLARASEVVVELEVAAVPVHPDAQGDSLSKAQQKALSDGEDHELIATLQPAAWESFRATEAGSGWARIGSVTRTRNVAGTWLTLNDGVSTRVWSPSEPHGFRH